MQADQPSSSGYPFRYKRQLLYGGMVAVVMFVALITLVILLHLYRLAENRAVETTLNLAKSLELTIEGMIDTVDVVLQSTAGEVEKELSASKPNIKAISSLLLQQRGRLPRPLSIRATNEHGDLLYGSDVSPPFANISDREHFIALRENPDSGMFVSGPTMARVNNKWIWIFARRLNKPDGSFAGIVSSMISSEEIDQIFARFKMGKGNIIALRYGDMRVIARYPTSTLKYYPIGEKLAPQLYLEAVKQNPLEGSYIDGKNPIEGVRHVHSYSGNPKYSFFVNVGMTLEAAFAEWRKQAWTVGLLGAILSLALLAFARSLNRGWLLQEKSTNSLHAVRQSLQEAQKIAQLGQFNFDIRADRWTSSDILDGIFGIGPEYTRNVQGWLDLVVPESRHEMQAYLSNIFEHRLPFDQEYRIIHHSTDQERWVYGKGIFQLDTDGTPLTLVGTIQDISHHKAHEAELLHVANHDSVTGLPNRRLLADRLRHAVANARRSNTHLAVCYMDLDEFKPVNDRFGHEAGDELLVTVTERLKASMRGSDTLARIGGDEFILLFGDLKHVEEIHVVLDRVLASVNAGMQIENTILHLTASIGVTIYPHDDVDADTLLRHADYAMYRAKETGKNRYQLFDPEHDRQVQEHRYNLLRLGEALENDEFVLHYQPKVDLKTGIVIGAEALIRWQHPDQGLLPPSAFLHYLDGSKLEIEIGEWVIDSVLGQIELWNRVGLDFAVSANISANHLLQTDFAERLSLALKRHPKVRPISLELEILETATLSDMERAVSALNVCRELGVQISLDDFGTGYSSLTYFRKLPIDILKIDQSFVRDMLESPDDLDLIESIVHLANVFNRLVIAEGVETLMHGAMLLDLGCRFVQGYGIARPMPAGQFPEWIEHWSKTKIWLTLEGQPQRPQRLEPTDLGEWHKPVT